MASCKAALEVTNLCGGDLVFVSSSAHSGKSGERSSSLRESSSSEPPSLGLTRGAPIGVPRGNRGSLPIGGSHAIAMERARSGDEPEDMRD